MFQLWLLKKKKDQGACYSVLAGKKKHEREMHNCISTKGRFHAGKSLLRYYLNVRVKTQWQKTLLAGHNFMCAAVAVSGTPELPASTVLSGCCHSSDSELVLSRHFSQLIQKHDSSVVLLFHRACVLAFPGTRKDAKKGRGSWQRQQKS